jgi:hypothetical protein
MRCCTVDAGCHHLDQDFVRPGLRHRTRFRQEHLRPAGLGDADHGHLRRDFFHGFSLGAEAVSEPD